MVDVTKDNERIALKNQLRNAATLEEAHQLIQSLSEDTVRYVRTIGWVKDKPYAWLLELRLINLERERIERQLDKQTRIARQTARAATFAALAAFLGALASWAAVLKAG